MPIVDIERGSELDKVHSARMLHAFSQVVLALFGLEDERVDRVLRQFSLVLMPGPVAALEYPAGGKQIYAERLAELNRQKALLEKKPKPAAKKKAKR